MCTVVEDPLQVALARGGLGPRLWCDAVRRLEAAIAEEVFLAVSVDELAIHSLLRACGSVGEVAVARVGVVLLDPDDAGAGGADHLLDAEEG